MRALVLASLGVILLLVLMIISFAMAAPKEAAGNVFDHRYPGHSADRTATIDLAFEKVQLGVLYFYRVHERWPDSWAEVVSDGLYAAPIYGPSFQVIDPDDNSLDFHLDLMYHGGEGKITRLTTDGRLRAKQLEVPMTYREQLHGIVLHNPAFNADYYLKDVSLLRVLAVAGIMERELATYHRLKGSYPRSIYDFADAGFGPLTRTMKNPKTGRPFELTGSGLFDLVFSSSGKSYSLRVTENSGNTVRFSY